MTIQVPQIDTEAAEKIADAVVKKGLRQSSDEVNRLKDRECEEHKSKTETLHCTLLDPQNGIAVKVAVISEKVNKIEENTTWAFRGVMAILVAILGTFFSQVLNTVNSIKTQNTQKSEMTVDKPQGEGDNMVSTKPPPMLIVNPEVEKLFR